ncbi:hypothetical protein RRG08_008645 [Elysia crispata]|uniref:Uncharacterized protein n=1 Tax=Elysia crispata TaxID=231223 RepID=A0AAE0XYE9_9GAST|nr:hypothetical protein RRG08_008645 [Elysia crispata]
MATAEDLVGKLVVTPVNRLKRRLDKLPTASVDSAEDMRLFEVACTMEDRGDLVDVEESGNDMAAMIDANARAKITVLPNPDPLV